MSEFDDTREFDGGDATEFDGSQPSTRVAGQAPSRAADINTTPRPLLTRHARVDHFEVIRLVGRGGMGEVYLARDTRLGRKVALKVVRPQALGDDQAIRRFLFEAKVTARFSHPNIVAIHHVGEVEGMPYVALEYLEGQSLRDRMKEGRPGVRESLRIALSIAEALTEAHRRDVLHRDLKPGNVLIPRDGRVRVVDFGLAKSVSRQQVIQGEDEVLPDDGMAPLQALDPFVTREGVIAGTPAFMAPEQWADGDLTGAADVWALGLIVYELLSGTRPIPAGAPVVLCASVCSPDPLPGMTVGAEVPQAIVKLVARCIDKDPDSRPTAAQVADVLQQHIVQRPTTPADQSPFRGLLPFDERHANLFLGREAEVTAFVERLREVPVLPVVGPSGAGKSSFVLAGVVPRLREQGRWIILRVRPGADPFRALASRLQRGEVGPSGPTTTRTSEFTSSSPNLQADGVDIHEQLCASPAFLAYALNQLALGDDDAVEPTRVLLLVDQLEELYTLTADEEVRRNYMAAICAAADDPEGPVRVVFTLRDDFLVRLAETPEAQAAFEHLRVLRSPGEESLREILTLPVQRAGHEYEDAAMVDEMIAAVRGEPACLPLLQFTCSQLWDRRDRELHRLTRGAYVAIGGVEGALANHADGVIGALPPDRASLARALLLRLVTPDNTRRVMGIRPLLEGLDAVAEGVLDRLVQERVVLVHRARKKERAAAEVELVHESLIRNWRRLADWLDESKEEIAFLNEIGQAAGLWERRGRPIEEVWGGDALADARRKLERFTGAPSVVKEFVEAGLREQQGRARRNRAMWGSSVAALAVVAVVFAWLAILASKRAEVAEHRGAEALLEGALTALERRNMLEARAKLRSSLEINDSMIGRAIWADLAQSEMLWSAPIPATAEDLAFTPDGESLFATTAVTRYLHVYDTDSQMVELLHLDGGPFHSIAISPDGSTLVAGSSEGEIQLLDLDGQLHHRLQGHTGMVMDIAIDPSGQVLASGGADGTVRLWELESGRPLRSLDGQPEGIHAVALHPEGKLVAAGGLEGTIRIWDVSSGELRRVLSDVEGKVWGVTFDKTGRRLLGTSIESGILMWDLEQPGPPLPLNADAGLDRVVFSMAFDPDTETLLTSGVNQVRLWDLAAEPILLRTIEAHDSEIPSAAMSPDGRYVASGSWDKTIRMWNYPRIRGAAQVEPHEHEVWSTDLMPDGQRLASGDYGGRVLLWDVSSGDPVASWRVDDQVIYDLEVDPAGERLAVSSTSAMSVWELESRTRWLRYDDTWSPSKTFAYHPDGTVMATVGLDSLVRIWDTASGEQLQTFPTEIGLIHATAFSPDGRLLAACGSAEVRVWSTVSWDMVLETPGSCWWTEQVAIHPTGDRVAVRNAEGGFRILAIPDGQVLAEEQVEHSVWSLKFHPTEDLLAVSVDRRGTGMYDLNTGQIRWFGGEPSVTPRLDFSADGMRLLGLNQFASPFMWDVQTGMPMWTANGLVPAGDGPPIVHTQRGWHVPGSTIPLDGSSWPAGVQASAGADRVDVAAGHLCATTWRTAVELFELDGAAPVASHSYADIERVMATEDGCAVVAAGQLHLLSEEGSRATDWKEVKALGGESTRILLGLSDRVVLLTPTGEQTGEIPVANPARSVAWVGSWLAMGSGEGVVELHATGADGQSRTLDSELSPEPVIQVIEGPPGIAVVAHWDGVIGLWNIDKAVPVASRRLQGSAISMMLHDHTLYAVSNTGGHLSWDLSIYVQPYDQLLDQVRAAIPVIWEDGHAVPSGE